ncbi:MAG: aldehyde ferredoxin oxidoreductase family protein [Desulfobacterales bacterium]|nr:MAG: aldehyde ferredoxin oxidoreductase family protein [Desulfobacterales bacterium]
MSAVQKILGYNGKILRIDLTARTITVDENDSGFYRTYPGGGLLGTYYVFKETRRGVDPLAPGNVLVFAPSVTTGAAITGVSRFNVTAKSPLTGAIGDTQCGGGWGPKLKHAGYDAIVIQGRASSPVYLWIDQGRVAIRDAAHLWGKTTGEAEADIRRDVGDERIEIAQIGPAGENQVRFACITGGLSHFAGRTGMGAVMGSKNLKAIALRGKRSYAFADQDGVKALTAKGRQRYQESELHQNFHKYGTAMGVSWFHKIGQIVTRNFQSGHFESTEAITGQKLTDTLLKGTDTCWACAVRCKRVVAMSEPYKVEACYGGPEYETISMLGSNLGIGDLPFICKANEICNKHTLDTISAGAMIAFAMECFENGLISAKDTGGLTLHFGNQEAVLELLEMIAARKGIGDVLADGYARAVSVWGEACRPFAIQVKNQPFPAHMPRIKPSQALMYAVNPFGADHMSSEHDWIGAAEGDLARGVAITDFTDLENLDEAKVRATMLSQFYYSLLDTLTVCDFCWGPGALYSYRDVEELVKAVTGWQVTFWELMKAGERRVNLMRAFNLREGLDRRQDRLPERVFEPLPEGPSRGRRVDRKRLEAALNQYYAMMNWDPATGHPTRGKLLELGLGWAADALDLK